MSDLPAGVYWDRRGYRAFVWVGGRAFSKRFPRDKETGELPSLETVTAWQRHTQADAERDLLPKHKPGTFAADVAEYLSAVTAMPTYKERVRDMHLWTAVFGSQPRSAITPLKIREQRDRWLTVGPRLVQYFEKDPVTGRRKQKFREEPRPLAPSTVSHRMRALENFFTLTNGKQAKNPVREVDEPDEDELPPQTVPTALIRRLLNVLPRTKSRARLAVFAWTGIPPKSIGRIEAEYLDLAAPAVWVPKRKKGKGATGRWIPLGKEGVKAFRELARLEAFGPFSWDNVRREYYAACRALKVPNPLNPYALRHAIAARTLKAVKDFKTTSELLGLSGEKMVLRYARAQVAPHLQAAVARIERDEEVQQKRRSRKRRPTHQPSHSKKRAKKR